MKKENFVFGALVKQKFTEFYVYMVKVELIS